MQITCSSASEEGRNRILCLQSVTILWKMNDPRALKLQFTKEAHQQMLLLCFIVSQLEVLD